VSLSPWVAVDAATIPATRARELRDAWEDFVDGRSGPAAEDPGRPALREPIVDSWRRSRDAGVDPSGRQAAPSVLDLEEARARWRAHPLACALPLIGECMVNASVEADCLVVVSDADGMLLQIAGDTRLRNRAADEMNFVEGALWSESGAGTNAVGTALAAEHAMQVFAAEHYTESVQRWTCAAAPVVDPDTGLLLGVLDLTGDISGVNPLSLSVVVATARAVEELLRGRLRERDDHLRARYGRLLGPGSAGAALVTGTGRVLLDPGRQWSHCGGVSIPAGGGVLALPSGVEAIAEPIENDNVYVVRPLRSASRSRISLVELRVLGGGPPGREGGPPAPASRRTPHPARAAPGAPHRGGPVRGALWPRRPPGEHPRRDVAAAQAAARRDRARGLPPDLRGRQRSRTCPQPARAQRRE